MALARNVRHRPLLTGIIAGVIVVTAVFGGPRAYAELGLGGGSPVASSSTAVNLQKGLVGQWKFDGNAKDSSPYADNGTVNGATLTTDRKGSVSLAYAFANNTDAISIPASSKLESQTLSLAAWIKPTSMATNMTVIGSGSNFGPQLQITGTGYIALNKQDQVQIAASSGPVISANVWSYVAATYDAATGTAKIYYNGALVGTATNSQSFVFSNYQIGKRADTTESFKGTIDDVRIYSRPLAPSEVSALSQTYGGDLKLASDRSGLTGMWKFDGNAKDSSPYANNGTVTAATLTADRKGMGNGAYQFDGSSSGISVPSNQFISTTSGTISFWFRADALQQNNFLFTCGDAGTDTSNSFSSLRAYFNSASNGVQTSWTTGSTSYGNSTAATTVGAWNQVAFTWDTAANATKTYLNGTYQGQTTYGATNKTNWQANCLFGRRYSGRYFSGAMDQVQAYSRALSQAEVTRLYDGYDPKVALGGTGEGEVDSLPSPALQYKMDGNTNDSSANGNNGTGTDLTSVADRRGVAGAAYSFNGTSSNIVAPSAAPQVGASDFTTSAWIKTSQTSGTGIIISRRNGSTSIGYDLRLSNGLPAAYMFRAPGDSPYTATGTVSVADNKWHHLAAAYQRTGLVTLYVDGIIVASTSISGDPRDLSSSSSINVGRDSFSVSNYYSGQLDDIQLYTRLIPAGGIMKLANLANISLGKGLIGEWNFNGNAKDTTPFANNAVAAGDPLPAAASDRRGRSGSAYYFASMNYPNGSRFNVPTAATNGLSTAATACVWIKPESDWGADATILSSAISMQRFSGDANTVLSLLPGGARAYIGGITLTAWNHLCVTVNGSNYATYLNGGIQNTGGGVTSFTATATIFGANSANQAYKGAADDYRLWNRALSPTEIAAVYADYR